MIKRTLYLLSVALVMISAGIAFSHIIHFSGKGALNPGVFLNVQQKLYENTGIAVGVVQFGAIITLLVSLVIMPSHSTLRPFFVIACAAMICMAGIWIFKINPSVLTLNSILSTKTFPEIVDFRKQLRIWHGLRGIAGLAGTIALAYAFVPGTKVEKELQAN
ncbi:MAG: hypothetical protein GF350_09275 [Chitinivibrionales bacterium]|nr:hypothetical protein [Chitinivibrionales bacterium]